MGVGLVVLGVVAFVVGYVMPRALKPSIGRNRPGHAVAAVLGPMLVIAGVVVLALGK